MNMYSYNVSIAVLRVFIRYMQSSEVFVMIESREKYKSCKYNRNRNTTNTGNGNNTYISTYRRAHVPLKRTLVNK